MSLGANRVLHQTADLTRFVLVLCLERFSPAHGGVERYALEIVRRFQHVCKVVVITAVRQDRSLQAELLARRGPYIETPSDSENIEIITAGLGRVGRATFRVMINVESYVHRVASSQYYRTRRIVMRRTARLLARELRHTVALPEDGAIVLHAMGPWEMSIVGDLLFPDAARVATPFIHPGYWGEDKWSRNWFRSRDGIIALGRKDSHTCQMNGVLPDHVDIVPVFSPIISHEMVPRRERRTVVFLGIARKYKGIDIFLEMATLLKTNRPDLEFVWAGSVPDEAIHLIPDAQAAGVHVLGTVGDEEKEAILSRALCLCLPSSTEISPYSILEAWAAGAPVVATDESYLREFVGQGGILVHRDGRAFAAAVSKLAEVPEFASRCVQAGLSHLQSRHDPIVVQRALTVAYRRAINRKLEREESAFERLPAPPLRTVSAQDHTPKSE